MINTDNEWFQAYKLLGGCIGTLNCGCSVSDEESEYVEWLHFLCNDYQQAYNDWLARRNAKHSL